jgi:hypothetical protein
VFYLSDRTYNVLQQFFLFIMWGNIILVAAVVAATLTRWAAVGVWLYAGGLAEIIRRWQTGS